VRTSNQRNFSLHTSKKCTLQIEEIDFSDKASCIDPVGVVFEFL